MKKFFVGLLSIFMICGGWLLAACGASTPQLKIYDAQGQEIEKALELEIDSSNAEDEYILLSAAILGGGDKEITASAASGYENVVSVKKDSTIGGKTFFKVVGLSESAEGPAMVVFSSHAYSLTKNVYINVYSQVNDMEKNNDEKANNFLVEGLTYNVTNNGFESEEIDGGAGNKIKLSLTENEMIRFSPSQNSRRELEWYIWSEGKYGSANTFTVDSKCIQTGGEYDKYVQLKATDVHEKGNGKTVEFKLPVIEAIASEIGLAWNNSDLGMPTAGDFTRGDESHVEALVSNVTSAENYMAYAWVGYAGDDLVITPVVEKKMVVGKGVEYVPVAEDVWSKELNITPQGVAQDVAQAKGYTYFAVNAADKDNTNDYRISFKVGYQDFNYAISTRYVYLDMKQMVEEVLVSTKGYVDLSGDRSADTEINIYDNYATVEGISRAGYGQTFKVEPYPNVLDGSGLYSIALESPKNVAGGITTSGCPIIIHHKAANGIVEELPMTDAGNGKWVLSDVAAAGELYICASDELVNQKTDGFYLTVTSKDNAEATTKVKLALFKSASDENMKGIVNGDMVIDSGLAGEHVITRILTLAGQSNLDGLSIEYEGSSLDFSKIELVSSNTADNEVTFKFTATLKEAAYGKTLSETYKIVHANGAESNEFKIDVILPFEELKVYPNTGDNQSNSISNAVAVDGDVVSLMLKNNKSTPLIFAMPSVNGSVPKITGLTVSYYAADKDSQTWDKLDAAAQEDILNDPAVESSVISFTHSEDFLSGSIATKGEGYVYLILSFTGNGIDAGAVQEKTVNKVILIESYNSPEGLRITPLTDGYVELYSLDSVSDDYADLTTKDINIQFENLNTTYYENNVTISHKILGENYKDYYSIDNLNVTSEGISFTITALSTKAEYQRSDVLNVVYSIEKDGKIVYQLMASVSLTIKNAQRVTSLACVNDDEYGIYFDIRTTGSDRSQYLVFQTSPIEVKDSSLRVVITDMDGDEAESQTFVQRNTTVVSDSAIALKLGDAVSEGKSGYAYILPNDAVFNDNIKYYCYLDENGNKVLFKNIESTENLTLASDMVNVNHIASRYNELLNYGFFISNVMGEERRENISFADIIEKIQIEVADGSEEHPLRIYNETQFKYINDETLNPLGKSLHYVVMNDLDFSDGSLISIDNLKGGIKGVSSDVTIKLNGDNIVFIVDEGAYISNLTFIGYVDGGGFVANINYGTIDNVTVDTNGNTASVLDAGLDAGGLVLINNGGVISNSSVLGLNINAGGKVGGIAAGNVGTISNCRVEFYNLVTGVDVTTGLTTYGANTFSGSAVAAFAAYMDDGGSITNTYAYDYTLSADNNTNRVLNGTSSEDPFVAECTAGTISSVFAVVGLDSTSVPADKISNHYLSYYTGPDAEGNYTYTSNVDNIGATGVVNAGDEGFDSAINGGWAYFKDMHQAKALTSLAGKQVQTIPPANGYYKSLEVDDKKGILFFYDIGEEKSGLSVTELNDLTEYNTIKITDLFNIDESGSVVATSSNNRILKVKGSTIELLKTGEVELTIGVKQDASISKTISISIINAMSDLVLTRTDENGRVFEITNDKEVNVQRTKQLDVSVSVSKTQLILGNLANTFEFVLPAYTLIPGSESVPNAVQVSASAGNIHVSTYSNSAATIVSVYPELFESTLLQTAVTTRFIKEFTVNPTDGVITFEISSEQKPLTPSTSTVVKAKVITTAKDDIVYPEIFMGQQTSAMERVYDGGTYTFMDALKNKVLTATRQLIKENNTDGTYTYEYSMTFAVDESYKQKVSDDVTFKVHFVSASGASSDSFTIKLTKQNITNVDTAIYKIESTYIAGATENYKAIQQVSTLAPGNAAILKVNVNPEFAYYDYAEISYNDIGTINAVNIEAVEAKDLSKGEFKLLTPATASTQKIGTKLRYIPNENSTNKHNLYFKLWINTTVDKDAEMQFTVSFYKQDQEEPLTFVNDYISVKYLAEPTVTIDGEEIAYISRGTTSDVTIQVRADQVLDGLTLSGEGISGVYLSTVSEPVVDNVRGIKTYTARLKSYVDAKTNDKNRFYIMASVSRELNGVRESKTAYATAVIVDFKVDTVSIYGANDGNLTVWQGAAKIFDVEYSLIPDDSEYIMTSEDEDAINALKKAKKDFATNHYYPENISGAATESEYYINWVEKTGGREKLSILDRLYLRTTEGDKPYNKALNLPFEISAQTIAGKEVLSIVGTKTNSGATTMVLYTYIYAGGIQKVVETEFTVTVETFSNPDLALPIKSAEDFLKLDPSTMSDAEVIEPEDYILENDIVLENYIPFSTNAIRSLDGNGYTIYIKSFDLETPTTLNLALFNEVTQLSQTEKNNAEYTTLKNVRVNYYNGGQITVDVSRHKEINIAGLAITNEGIITNCEVVSFYQTGLAGESLDGSESQPCTLHTKAKGFNVAYRDGANTSEDVFLGYNSTWSSQIAGFVLNNNGNITNSRVGGDEIYLITSASTNNNVAVAEIAVVDKFSIIGQGNIAGFVLNNTGSIASSFVKKAEIANLSADTSFIAAGFVGYNSESASILTSYVEGVRTSDTQDNRNSGAIFANLGSSISSDMGHIAGFIFENKGNIKDSYSNILISNDENASQVYLASGFVYINEGVLENCYSASQVENANYSQMNFSGVNKDGELLVKSGEYINCYYFSVDQFVTEAEEMVNDTTEAQFNTGAVLIYNPLIASSYYGFAVAENITQVHKDGTWVVDDVYGIKLIDADYIAYSHRFKKTLADNSDSKYFLTQEDGTKYELQYGALQVGGRLIDTKLGGNNNPILIANADDWQGINGASDSSYIKEYYLNGNISGVYRLVDDVDLSTVTEEVLSTTNNFTGALYGNGFEISGIAISSNAADYKFGLFASITSTEDVNNRAALISNVTLDIKQVTAGNVAAVGGLAGVIQNATIVNVELNFDEDAIVEGRSFVGGLVGFAYNSNKIKNITVTNPNVLADAYTEEDENYLNAAKFKDFRSNVISGIRDEFSQGESVNYSYAGSVIGFIDSYDNDPKSAEYTTSSDAVAVYEVNNIRVNGNVKVKAQVVGGVFGLVGPNTDVNDIGLTLNASNNVSSKLISTRYFAGGIAGQSFGRISRAFAVHEIAVQEEIEDNMAKFYAGDTGVERGILDLFDTTKTDIENTQIAIGGLIGYVGSGMLDISYSKLNVTAVSAKYAGGIIGYSDISNNQRAYDISDETIYFESGSTATKISTKYYIKEVYATGDVRANTMAGGLFGAIKGENSNIDLIAVNAFNYITTYNYETGSYEKLNKNQYNLSSNFKINNFVGQLIEEDGDIATFADRSVSEGDIVTNNGIKGWDNGKEGYKVKLMTGKLEGYIEFLTAQESGEDGESNGSLHEPLASVAKYNYYSFEGQPVYLSRFGEDMLTTKDGEGNEIYFKEAEDLVDFNVETVGDSEQFMLQIYSVGSPAQYTDSTVGHTMTQAGFLNSGIWSYANWSHYVDDLFATIKLKETYDVVYLDVWNANSVFNRMATTPNLMVIVRGLIAADANVDDPNSYADIEIYKAGTTERFTVKGCTSGEAFEKLESFAGKIIGGRYPIDARNEDEFTKIISHYGNFIGSTQEGFSVTNQAFVYDSLKRLDGNTESAINNPEDIVIDKGLFVNSSITGAKLVGLRIILKDNVKATGTSSPFNYGLIAPEIKSTTMSNIKIETQGVDTGKALLSVEHTTAIKDEMNIGLFAGLLAQESAEKNMIVEKLELNTDINGQQLISTSELSFEGAAEANVGGYFGKVTNASNYVGTEKIDTLKFNLQLASIENKGIIQAQSSTFKAISYAIGGFVGNLSGVSYLTKDVGKTNNYNLEFIAPKGNANSKLYLGNVFGYLHNGAEIILDAGQNNTNSADLTQEISAGSITVDESNSGYIGGAVGYHEGSPLTIKGFKTVKLNTTDEVNLVGDFDYGGLVGCSDAQLEIPDADIQITGDIALTSSNNKLAVGSLVGAITAKTTSGNTTTSILGNITSTAEFTLSGKQINFGGIIGNLYNSATDSDVCQKVELQATGILAFNGDVIFSSTEASGDTVNLGGIVGLAYGAGSSSIIDLTISNTSFGGSFKVQDSEDASVTVGGTVGGVNAVSSASKISLKNGYNYGNTYVDYSEFTKLYAYNYGGLIGSAATAEYSITKNYVAASSHNSRYMTSTTDTAHALFGKGEPTTDGSVVTGNYYSHAVCLLTDDLGTDIGYNTAYTDRLGYNMTTPTEDSVVEKICVGLYGRDYVNHETYKKLVLGHKLKPKAFDDTGITALNVTEKFKGLTYYTLTKNVTVANSSFELKDAAFIGDGFKVTYKNTDQTKQALFTNANNYSFVSSLVEDVDIKLENASMTNYAGLMVELSTNAQIYAVNVYGTIDVGSTNNLMLGALSINTNGKVFDSSTDVDIIERGTNGSYSYGFVYASNIGSDPLVESHIENCFSLGSVTTYSGGGLRPFNGAEGTVSNCYSATKVDWRDYLTLSDALNVYYGTTTMDIKYDVDAIGRITSSLDAAHKFTYRTCSTSIANANVSWISEGVYNYGYPTLKYQYLKMSSWATQEQKENDCGTEHTTSVCDDPTYDCYVENYSYKRSKNGTIPTGADQFFMVPNAGVFAEHIAKNLSSSFALKYDIDLTQTSTYVSRDGKGKITKCTFNLENELFIGQLDGQGHTIKGLTDSLFGQVGSAGVEATDTTPAIPATTTSTCYVRNLRLTDINFTTTLGSASETSVVKQGALAKHIQNATISNMTLGGNINVSATIQKGFHLGALAGSSSASNIDTVESTVIVDVTLRGTSHYIGGLIGKDEQSAISYCSNYGNLNTKQLASDTDLFSPCTMGGIVGSGKKSTIKYCSNVGTLLNNYNFTTSDGSTYENHFRTAGIAGAAIGGEVLYCYNSGVIKSGDKTKLLNISGYYETVVGNEVYPGKPFLEVAAATAAGIVASCEELVYSEEIGSVITGQKLVGSTFLTTISPSFANWDGIETPADINNCYNEGTVEALGKNPEYGYSHSTSTGDKRVYIKQKSIRNVLAYGIGPSADSSNICVYKKSSTGATSVFANGSALRYDEVIKYFTYTMDKWVPQYKYDKVFVSTSGVNMVGIQLKYTLSSSNITLIEDGKFTLTDHAGNSYEREYQAKSNICDLPLSLVYSADYYLQVMAYTKQGDNPLGVLAMKFASYSEWAVLGRTYHYSYYIGRKATITENFIMPLDLHGDDKFSMVDHYVDLSRKKADGDTTTYVSTEEIKQDAFKEAANQIAEIKRLTKPNEDDSAYQSILVAGNNRFYIAQNNLSMFQAGMLSQEVEFTFKDVNSAYATYSIDTITAGGEAVLISQPTFTVSGDTVTGKMKVYYDETGDPLSIALKASYSTSDTIDTSILQLYLTDDGNIGLGLTSIDTAAISHWESVEIKKDSETYQAYKLSNAADPTKEIYVLHERDDFIYVPGATLSDGTNVNTLGANELIGETWELNYTGGATRAMDFFRHNGGSGTVINPVAKDIVRVDTDVVTNGRLPYGLTKQYSIALDDGGNPVASTSDMGTTWSGTGVTQHRQIVGGSAGTLYQKSESTATIAAADWTAEWWHEGGDEIQAYYITIEDGDLIENIEFELTDGSKVEPLGVDGNKVYAENAIHSSIVSVSYDKFTRVADVESDGVVVNATVDMFNSSVIANVYYKDHTAILQQFTTLSTKDIYLHSDANQYIVANDAVVDTSDATTSVTINDFDVTLEYKATESETTASHNGVDIITKSTVTYDEIYGFNITQNKNAYLGAFKISLDGSPKRAYYANTKNMGAMQPGGMYIPSGDTTEVEIIPLRSYVFAADEKTSGYKVGLQIKMSDLGITGVSDGELVWLQTQDEQDLNGDGKIDGDEAAKGSLAEYGYIEVDNSQQDYKVYKAITSDHDGDGEIDEMRRGDLLGPVSVKAKADLIETYNGVVGITDDDKYQVIDDDAKTYVELTEGASSSISIKIEKSEVINPLPSFSSPQLLTLSSYKITDKSTIGTECNGAVDYSTANLTLYAKPSKYSTSETYTLTGSQNISSLVSISPDKLQDSSTVEACSIVLTKDISIGNIPNALEQKMNIIGNGYNLSYYGKGLFSNIVEDKIMSNINLLGAVDIDEFYDAFIYGGKTRDENPIHDTARLQGIKMFGSVLIKTTLGVKNVLIGNVTDTKNIALTSYVSCDFMAYEYGFTAYLLSGGITDNGYYGVALSENPHSVLRSTTYNFHCYSNDWGDAYKWSVIKGGTKFDGDGKTYVEAEQKNENYYYLNYDLKSYDFSSTYSKYSVGKYIPSRLAFTITNEQVGSKKLHDLTKFEYCRGWSGAVRHMHAIDSKGMGITLSGGKYVPTTTLGKVMLYKPTTTWSDSWIYPATSTDNYSKLDGYGYLTSLNHDFFYPAGDMINPYA